MHRHRSGGRAREPAPANLAGQPLAAIDGRNLSTEVIGFLGRVLAMSAVGDTAAFDRFEHEQR